MKRLLYLLFPVMSLAACAGNQSDAKSTTVADKEKTTQSAPAPKASIGTENNALWEKAKKKNDISASSMQNLTTGYWHIGGSVGVRSGKDNKAKNSGYIGEWIKFNQDLTFEAGKDNEDLGKGVWFFNEKANSVTISSNTHETFYNNEWKLQLAGDVIILLGNTEANNNGVQIKLVRQDGKVIEHNPN